MICVFVQFRCTPGKTYDVATAVYDREVVSELYSTSGEYDLIAKIYIPDDADVGHYLSERLFDIPGIVRTLTTMTFKAFLSGQSQRARSVPTASATVAKPPFSSAVSSPCATFAAIDRPSYTMAV